MPFQGLHPVVEGPQLIEIQFVNATLALLSYGNDADLPQHAQVFRNRRLRQPQRQHDCPHSQAAAARKQVDDLPPSRLGDGVD